VWLQVMAGFIKTWGLQLVDKGNKPFDLQQLGPSDIIAFYFSAHWCPPCRQFTPLLRKFVELLNAAGDYSLKIIFVSSDKSETEMWKYMSEEHGNWLALTYGSSQKDQLSSKYSVSGIPSLMVINGAGQSVVPHAVQIVIQAMQNSTTQVFKTMFDWRTASGAAPAAPPVAQLAKDMSVKVVGLVSKPELNGEMGSVVGYNREKQRYDVQLGETIMSLKPANLLQMVSVIMPCDSGAEEEHQEADIVNVDTESGELVLKQGDKEIRARLGDELGPILKDGTYVVVHGLKAESAKQLNECLGRVASFEKDKGRYLIEMAPNMQKSIKPDNLRLYPLA